MSDHGPDPAQPFDASPHKSKHGRTSNIRHFDKNKQAADRVRGQLRIEGKLRYGKVKR